MFPFGANKKDGFFGAEKGFFRNVKGRKDRLQRGWIFGRQFGPPEGFQGGGMSQSSLPDLR